MRFITIFLISTFIVSAAVSQDADTSASPELKTNNQKMSYAIGRDIGSQLKKMSADLDRAVLFAAISSVFDGDEAILNDAEIREVFTAYQEEIKTRNKEAADKFLAENAKKEGVQTTKSGLQYIVVKEGTGATPAKKDTVSAHYRGTLADGSVFDESYKGDNPTADERPVPFGVTQVIPGWTEALQLMKVGAHYRLFIPPDLAYGSNGNRSIAPNSLLLFDIRLISVK